MHKTWLIKASWLLNCSPALNGFQIAFCLHGDLFLSHIHEVYTLVTFCNSSLDMEMIVVN